MNKNSYYIISIYINILSDIIVLKYLEGRLYYTVLNCYNFTTATPTRINKKNAKHSTNSILNSFCERTTTQKKRRNFCLEILIWKKS